MSYRTNWSERLDAQGLNDALEAYNIFQSARNLVFWLSLLLLLGLAATFWIVDMGKTRLAIPDMEDTRGTIIRDDARPDAGWRYWFTQAGPEALPPDIALPEDDDAPAPSWEAPRRGMGPRQWQGPGPNNDAPAWRGADEDPALRAARAWRGLVDLYLQTCRILLTFLVLLFSLCLLLGLKVSLVGRLGGLADAMKAFLVSLLLVLLLVPWQSSVAEGVPGAMFTLSELEEAYQYRVNEIDEAAAPLLLAQYYGRFVGLWVLSVLLLVVAQLRSCRAGRTVRARLAAIETGGKTLTSVVTPVEEEKRPQEE